MVLTTTAIIPLSAFTTPRKATWSIARHRLPELQPDSRAPKLTTGLTNGSRRPAAFTALGAGFLLSAVAFLSATATVVAEGKFPLGAEVCLSCALAATLT